MITVDTNILLRAALNDDPAQSVIAQQYLAQADGISIPLQAFCEFVWVMTRSYKLRTEHVVAAVLDLLRSDNVVCNREAVAVGLAFLVDGGDFADGVIEFEGRMLGGETFVTFDKRAAAIVEQQGHKSLLLAGE